MKYLLIIISFLFLIKIFHIIIRQNIDGFCMVVVMLGWIMRLDTENYSTQVYTTQVKYTQHKHSIQYTNKILHYSKQWCFSVYLRVAFKKNNNFLGSLNNYRTRRWRISKLFRFDNIIFNTMGNARVWQIHKADWLILFVYFSILSLIGWFIQAHV